MKMVMMMMMIADSRLLASGKHSPPSSFSLSMSDFSEPSSFITLSSFTPSLLGSPFLLPALIVKRFHQSSSLPSPPRSSSPSSLCGPMCLPPSPALPGGSATRRQEEKSSLCVGVVWRSVPCNPSSLKEKQKRIHSTTHFPPRKKQSRGQSMCSPLSPAHQPAPSAGRMHHLHHYDTQSLTQSPACLLGGSDTPCQPHHLPLPPPRRPSLPSSVLPSPFAFFFLFRGHQFIARRAPLQRRDHSPTMMMAESQPCLKKRRKERALRPPYCNGERESKRRERGGGRRGKWVVGREGGGGCGGGEGGGGRRVGEKRLLIDSAAGSRCCGQLLVCLVLRPRGRWSFRRQRRVALRVSAASFFHCMTDEE